MIVFYHPQTKRIFLFLHHFNCKKKRCSIFGNKTQANKQLVRNNLYDGYKVGDSIKLLK